MPVDADEALRRATLIRSDPSLKGVTRENIAENEGEVLWLYRAPDGDPIEEKRRAFVDTLSALRSWETHTGHSASKRPRKK